jgi:tetratricopeptide (TPR) repeat protein
MIDMPDWQFLKGSAILRKHAGDIDGAIVEILKAISLTRSLPSLSEETELSLNYLAAELYLTKNELDQAEEAIRDAIELARSRRSPHLGDHLWVLADIRTQKGDYQQAIVFAEEARQSYEQWDHSYGVAQAEELIERIKTNLAEKKKGTAKEKGGTE